MAEHAAGAGQAGSGTTGRGTQRAWLDVPFSEKDQAKALGARWDPVAKRWYDPRPPTTGLDRWAARPPIPDLLPGEDRAFGSGLFVDMVPRTCWFTNVRTCVSQQDWERLRRMITGRADRRCEICGAVEDRKKQLWLEAHERWAYDEASGVQTLRRLICLCSACHLSTHFGYANVTGRTTEALTHLHQVTGMSAAQADRHIADAGRIWTQRSQRRWTLDLSMLTDAGITLARPQARSARARTADRELAAARCSEATATPRPATQPSAGESGISVAGDIPNAQQIPDQATSGSVRTTCTSTSWFCGVLQHLR